MIDLRSLTCPNCGAPVTMLLANGLYACSFCNAQIVPETDPTFNGSLRLCDCGLNSIANCKRCPAWLCEKHALTLAQFDLDRILEVAFQSLSIEEGEYYVRDIRSALGRDTVYCASCFDLLLDQWLVDISKLRNGGY
jgi:hypothetical protein